MEQYDSVGWLYEILCAEYNFDDLCRFFLDEHGSLVKQYKNRRIHDVSCGNGIQAIALGQAGYHISASDVSSEMIGLAQKNADDRGLQMDFFQSDWREIPAIPEVRYGLLLCVGNSICHAAGKSDRTSVLCNFYEMLEKGGALILDSRNWELLIRENETYNVLPNRSYRGKNYIPVYLWQTMELEKRSKLKIVFIELSATQQVEYEVTLQFVPFGHRSICKDCKNAGFSIINDTYDSEGENYCLYLRK